MTITLNKLGTEGMYLNIIKAIYEKPTINDKQNGGNLKTFLLKLKKKNTSNPFLPLLFNTILEVLATTMRDRK